MRQAAPNIEELFFAALELESPEARSAFLDRHCGDLERRREVEELLALDSKANDFLEAPASSPTVSGTLLRVEEPGTVIGPYKLMEAIGEGGMGVVYVAEQSEPVRRRVALKVIKPGMDSKQVVARFEAERQALAMMDHPNIARVFDGGVTPSGRPYFVMELVRGLPITEYCDQHQLTIAERLELFVLVCRAVQHGHQKGVIHRDLKPSNVLVTVIDGAAVPKVIDFGVAKATGQALTDKTVYTGFHQFVGTPLYVSPEQADLANTDVDTRSDIYSLGVLLYELLTGTTPFDSESLKRAAFDEMRRIIREEEPQKPSTRLSSLGKELTTVSARRKADPKRLVSAVKGDLDWVVMKAQEKDRRRRYETANDFAADVLRYLSDRPVEAFPPSAWYRFSKFARRNRMALAFGATAASFLILAVVGQAVSAILINHQRNEAVRQRNVSRRAVDDMYTQVAEKWLAQQPNLTALQQSFLEKALGYYEQFADEPVDGPEMQLGAARARGKVAAIHHKFGRVDEADRALRRSVEELDDLVARFPGRVEYRRELALKLYDLAALRLRVGRAGDAEAPSIRAVSIAEDLAALQPSVGEARCDLAFLLCKRGNVLHDLRRGVEAEAALRRSRDLFGTHVGTVAAGPRCRSKYAECSMTLGLVLVRKRDLPGAERAYREALRVQEALVKQVPDDPDVSYFPCVTLINLARAELVSGRSEEAIATFKASSDRLAALVDRFSDHRGYTSTLVVCLTDLFQILREVGSPEEAEGVGRRGVELAERLVREYPGVTLHSRELADILYRLADFYSIPPDGHPIEPEKALELASRAAELEPENGMALQSLGWAKFRAGDMRGCIEALEKTSSYPKAGDFFASMACWHLGDRTRARTLFDQHSNWLDGYENRWNPGTYPSPAMLRRLQAEAAALLGVESPRVKAP